ncbi:MAG TPA: hypothetical protein VGI95_08115 [Caulobacteraceae bacterium]
MPTIRDLGLLAAAVYDENPAVSGWSSPGHLRASGAFSGFQAATFVRDGMTIVVYRGTAQTMDVAADVKLGAGMNSTYFSAGEDYLASVQPVGPIWVCGHSLGGAIAQVVANRRNVPMITFNAPGVAVFASREIGQANLPMAAVRTAGMLVSSLRHPMQAYRDVRSTFHTVRGMNICLENDAVSQIGLHYGEVVRIRGTSSNPLTEHRMATVNQVLATNPIGARDLLTLR